MKQSYIGLNSELNLYDENNQIQLDRDREAAKAYFLEHVNPNTVFFHDHLEKFDYLIENGYYDPSLADMYSRDSINELYLHAYFFKFRFPTFVGAFKFYTSYALKTYEGDKYLERYEDRVVATAMFLGDGNFVDAFSYINEMLSGRYQPATPTFLNAGRLDSGELVSCFLLRIEDNMESIGRAINSSLQLSKRGGGVALLLSNIREEGAPIKRVEGASSGLIPIMKILEDSFSYANQLGARQGAGAVYLSVMHKDIYKFLDTKRENADEKIRIKTLSLGVVIPDLFMDIAREGGNIALFSAYDVEQETGVAFADVIWTRETYNEFLENEFISKTFTDPRELLSTVAEIQLESGYPYILFEDAATRGNPLGGKITHSNLCSEVLEESTPSEFADDLSYTKIGDDISCNLGSLNIAKAIETGSLDETVARAIRALNRVAESTSIDSVPSIRQANENGRAIGLGAMNLHGFLAKNNVEYGSPVALRFTSMFFETVRFYALCESMRTAEETGRVFDGFEKSRYADGTELAKYTEHYEFNEVDREAADLFGEQRRFIPTDEDWAQLLPEIMRNGLHNRYLMAIPPTGSISYINHSTSSIHPITAPIEIRKEGKLGRVYYPAHGMTNENREFYKDAYELGWKATIDTYAAATPHVDQGLSLTLFFPGTVTTRELNKAQIYAWRRGIKTLYYVRIRQQALSGTEVDGCVSCTL